jgi:GH15 family glucan-1,4-alpha-glucosidase
MNLPAPVTRVFPDIRDYAVIGDCRAAAIISNLGSIDWLCWPRFDSPAIFSAMLDLVRGGSWSIRPASVQSVTRKYVGDSNVLQTSFRCAGGEVVLTDLMPVAAEETKARPLLPEHELIREVRCTAGEVQVDIHFEPRAGYGASACSLRHSPLGIRAEVEGGVYYLRSSHPLAVTDGKARACHTLRTGDVVQFSLTYGEESPVVLPPIGEWTQHRIEATVLWWQQWASRVKYDGEYGGPVLRSALALKLLTYAPSGAVVAAATTSLPERIGGHLNWDYRYCWLRDASLTVRAMLGLGYYDEADAFINWLLHATALTRPELRIVYTVFGNNAPREQELEFLSGYKNSRPVRIGNAARDQLQLDVYGEVIDAAAQYAHAGGSFDRTTQKVLIGFGQYVLKNWNRPDEGIWEPRGARENHTHSRLLCWTALDRLIKLEARGFIRGAPVAEMKRERERIWTHIREHAWNERLRSYVSVLGGDRLDASLLLLSYYGFERADSERMRSTYAALRKNLGAGDLIYRYPPETPEGAFGICSFWEVEYLALGGSTLDQARDLFSRIVAYSNDLGLFSEEIDPANGAALGNFPQAFTHVGLISAALSISEREKGQRQLPHREHTAEHNHAATEALA